MGLGCREFFFGGGGAGERVLLFGKSKLFKSSNFHCW